MSTTRDNVLFVCTGNSCRSQMAEAFLRKYASDRFHVHSAGTHPKDIHPLTRQVMAEVGLDLAGQFSKGIGTYLGRLLVHYLILVCAKAAENCPTAWPGSPQMRVLLWPMEDPTAFRGTEEETLAQFREVRDRVDARIQAWLKELP
jgi:arsenate reductase (thioredoxin)